MGDRTQTPLMFIRVAAIAALVLVPQRAPSTFPYKDKPVSKKVTYQDLTPGS